MLFFAVGFNFCLAFFCIYAAFTMWRLFNYFRLLNLLLEDIQSLVEQYLQSNCDSIVSNFDRLAQIKNVYTKLFDLIDFLKIFSLIVFPMVTEQRKTVLSKKPVPIVQSAFSRLYRKIRVKV